MFHGAGVDAAEVLEWPFVASIATSISSGGKGCVWAWAAPAVAEPGQVLSGYRGEGRRWWCCVGSAVALKCAVGGWEGPEPVQVRPGRNRATRGVVGLARRMVQPVYS